MRVSSRRFFELVLLVFVFLAAAAPVHAQQAPERRLITVPNADYAGNDYKTLKAISLDACKAACLGDKQCRAFTYDEKARWCFLKSGYGDLSAAAGATAGRIAVSPKPDPALAGIREAELAFLPKPYFDEAETLASGLSAQFNPAASNLAALLSAGDEALRARDFRGAVRAYGEALVLAGGTHDLWMRLAIASGSLKPKLHAARQRAIRQATGAAINAYLSARLPEQRARALSVLGHTFRLRAHWRPAIRALRASLALVEDENVRKTYEQIVTERGFRIVSHQVDADSVRPRICIVLSDPIPMKNPALSSFVAVEGESGLAVNAEDRQLCIEGVKHGQRYRVTVRAGLPARDGEKLEKSAELNIYVRDRAPWVGFAGKSYVLPRGAGATIPIVSVNTRRARAAIYRIGERALAASMRTGVFLRQLSPGDMRKIADETGERVWRGVIEIDSRLNVNVTTAIPVTDVIKSLQPGVYVLTARAQNDRKNEWGARASQWFIISDLGLSVLKGADGLHAVVRSLSTARVIEGARVRLIAANDTVLGTGRTGANGYIHFKAGLTRASGGNRPRVLVAQTGEGDYAFLDLEKAAFDLSDRGVDGRAAPGEVDVFLTTERGVYRPGETVHITALARDRKAAAMDKLPLTLRVERPDGVEFSRTVLMDQGQGGYNHALRLNTGAMRGSWRLSLYADPKGKALAGRSILVEDFEPERLAFDLEMPETPLRAGGAATVKVAARYLYGAPAGGLSLAGDIRVKAVRSGSGAFAGYQFGLADEDAFSVREPLDITVRTDREGLASFAVMVPKLPATNRLYEASVIARLRDVNGRAVERKLSRLVEPDGPRIGIRPLFKDGTVDENSSAGFEVVAFARDGTRLDIDRLNWTLEKIETSFQWYRFNGSWNYEPVTSSQRVGAGMLDLSASSAATLSVPVKWGRYRLRVQAGEGGATATSIDFSAGWASAGMAQETPDFLNLSLDRKSYKAGETARLRIKPRFAGRALVAVVDTHLLSIKEVEVPEAGATVDLKITSDWGPGAYVTATLFRPMDRKAGRMPARALGVKWLKVDPGTRKLDVALDLPARMRPRRTLSVPVRINGLKPGTQAYVAVAAVDVGILNLTGYEAPAPGRWYFGQRRLGMEIRDLYGQLIEQMQGAPGRIRSGGDAAGRRLGAPPPVDSLVAYHSGIVRVGADGGAIVSFDIPEFNGTVRVMAMAWSRDGVGEASGDVVVRDPVVVSASLPRYLAPGDTSRLLLEIANVDGEAGAYSLRVADDGGVAIAPGDGSRSMTLNRGERRVVAIPLTARKIGTTALRVTLGRPDGEETVKDLTLAIRSSDPVVVRRRIVRLNARDGRLTMDTSVLAGLVAGTGSATVSVSAAPGIDIPGLLTSLDRYPYGCAEQITSRALPLVYLDDIARAAGMGDEEAVRKRVREAISGVLANQSSSGGFGLWAPGSGDMWLDAYVTDFLTRAREKGYAVPDLALQTALDNLANQIAYASDFSRGGEGIAYGLYVLARNGRAAIGDLRYYAEAKLDAFAGPLPKAQIGAALALYGDRKRASRVFGIALSGLEFAPGATGWRPDYGSAMRDGAAILTLAAETRQSGVDLAKLAGRISEARGGAPHTSTQENAWLLLAANAMAQRARGLSLMVDASAVSGSYFRKFTRARLAQSPVVIENRGAEPIDAVITTRGVPEGDAPAGGNGFAIERTYFTHDGKPADISAVVQNDRFIVVLRVKADPQNAGRLLVVDPLPAGFEIENPNLTASGNVSGLNWLGIKRRAIHTEARADRFIAAIDRKRSDPAEFRLAYSVRAVSPGRFHHPAASVEDMYRPALRARTATGRLEVVGPVR